MTMPAQHPHTSKQDYQTPPEFITAVKRLLGIDAFRIDLAASPENTQAVSFYSKTTNALDDSTVWPTEGWCWLNPPFKDIMPWVTKARKAKDRGSRIAMLVPASVGSNWWWYGVHGEAQALYLKGRLTFVGCTAPYPKDCALLLYRPHVFGGDSTWHWRGELTASP